MAPYLISISIPYSTSTENLVLLSQSEQFHQNLLLNRSTKLANIVTSKNHWAYSKLQKHGLYKSTIEQNTKNNKIAYCSNIIHLDYTEKWNLTFPDLCFTTVANILNLTYCIASHKLTALCTAEHYYHAEFLTCTHSTLSKIHTVMSS